MSGWGRQGPPVLVGESVLWLGSGSGLPKAGVVRWIGRLPEIGPDWTVGLELKEALPIGGIDGTWGGRELFKCKPKHGLIVPISNIIPGSHLKGSSITLGLEKLDNAADLNLGVRSERHKKPLPQPKPTPGITESKTLPRAATRHKRRIPTPPPGPDSDEPLPRQSETEQSTLRVEERDQEDSLKKRLRLFTESNGEVQRMNRHYNESIRQEVVIDSLYAQSRRRQQFSKHGRSQSDSSHTFLSSESSPGSRRDRNSIFSIFRWFRKENRNSDFDEFAPSAPPSPQLIRGHSSSCGSVDTLFSTATANSFAFVNPASYRPFGAASQPEKRIYAGPETDTYRNRLRHRDRVRELDKNLTLRKKYQLFGSDTLYRSVDDVTSRSFYLNKSLDSLKLSDFPSVSKNSTLSRKKRKAPPPPLIEEKSKEPSRTNSLENNKENANTNSNLDVTIPDVILSRPQHRRTVSDSAKDRRSFVHVKGKRKAPPPPVTIEDSKKDEEIETNAVLGTQSLGRKKKHAPLPPLKIVEQENKAESQGSLSPGEKQRLIENIAKLQAHADRRSVLLNTPPASPELNKKMANTVCNDTLKLEKGVLKAIKTEIQSSEMKTVTPTPVSPRPWYKRNMMTREKSFEKKSEKGKIDDWMPEVVIARGSVISQDTNSCNSNSNSNSFRLSSIFSRFEKPEEKRKSQISMLVNISELDREAAEIVQREQEKEKAMLAIQDAKYYTVEEPLTPTESPILEAISKENQAVINLESPKRSGARELISLFNSITNVTKVTVNSAFFSKDSSSVCTKSVEEKRFSMTGDVIKLSEEKVLKENISRINGLKRETVESREISKESPLNKRRFQQQHQDARDVSSSSSFIPVPASSKVVIEEVEDSDTEKTRTQALYEANRIRKHLTPSPTIPTITEMSESITSITSSHKSTLNTGENASGTAVIPVSVASPHAEGRPEQKTQTEASGKSSQVVSQSKPNANYSIWSCPRCTLENPRWRVTCEACDMWRPAVRKDVIDKLTNANMGTTIAVNVIKAGESKNSSAVKSLISQNGLQSNGTSKVNSDEKESTSVKETEAEPVVQKTYATESGSVLEGSLKKDISKPITVSGLLSNKSYKPREPSLSGKEISPLKCNRFKGVGISSTSKEVSSSSGLSGGGAISKLATTESILNNKEEKAVINVITNTVNNASSKEVSMQQPSTSKGDSELEEVRKARLAFFQKQQSDEAQGSDEAKKEVSHSKPCIEQSKIDTLFSIASKGSLATNDEERRKIKEILKEMKNSLPKKPKDKTEASQSSQVVNQKLNSSTTENIQISVSSNVNNDASKLGAIKKSSVKNFTPLSNNIKKKSNEKPKEEEKSEVYLVKTETIIEEIRVKAKDSPKNTKVSTSVQTNGILRKLEPTPSTSTPNSDEVKLVSKKPPTPKAIRKEVSVPVTVEEHIISGSQAVTTSTSKEQRMMGIKNFELIRPRDFANIEATKTGNEAKIPLVHFYANIPTTHNEDSEASSSSSSESPEVSQLTAQLTKPKGLADFKATMLESAAGNKMNTLAVNRLLRQLEAAIAGGEHQRAATLAKQLARHKVSCCVTRQKHTEKITVNMFVEDKLSHQGPFPVQVSPTMTVAHLKAKVEREFEIPATVQRWILGKELAADDSATLKQLGVDKPQCPIFLYLVAPEINQNRTKQVTAEIDTPIPNSAQIPAVSTPAVANVAGPSGLVPPTGRGWYFNEENDRYSYCESEITDQSSKDASPEPPVVPTTPVDQQPVAVEDSGSEEEVEVEEEEVEEEGAVAAQAAAVEITNPNGTLAVGWRCNVCTLVNSPTRPGCLACATDRPVDYTIPENYEASGTERHRLEQDQEVLQAAAAEKTKNYQELMVLENADLIPTTEPFECSVCLTECAAQDGITLRDCLHVFCRACLAHTVQFSDEAEVKCPFRDHNYACDSTLQEREIKAVTDSEEDDSCIICMAEPRCCALTPCGHRAYCETCCLRLIELDQMCSLCRRKADGYLLIYL